VGLAPLRGAVQAILDRHDVLRGRLVRSATGEVEGIEVAPSCDVLAESCVSAVDVSAYPDDELPSVITGECAQARTRLTPDVGSMVQVIWFDAGPARAGQLLLMLHHLVVDGVSWRILLPDLATAWQQISSGRLAKPDPVPTSFRTWA